MPRTSRYLMVSPHFWGHTFLGHILWGAMQQHNVRMHALILFFHFAQPLGCKDLLLSESLKVWELVEKLMAFASVPVFLRKIQGAVTQRL